MKILSLAVADSTNNWVASHEKELPATCFVKCHTQTHGRGQRGNSWESAPGKNITGSLLIHPQDFPASAQFLISEAVALGVSELLSIYGIHAKVKWPNDIYVGDNKIAGILFEHVIYDRNIHRTISGIGLNVNQTIFNSDAPNPVSMKQITGKEYDLEEVAQTLTDCIERNIEIISSGLNLHSEYMDNLWRNDGRFHPFHEKKTARRFLGRILSVAHDGILTLEDTEGNTLPYAFKEIEFLRE